MISNHSKLLRILTPALALSLCAGVVTAQNQTRDRDQDQRQQDRQDDRRANQPGQPMEDHPLWRQPVDDDDDWQSEEGWSDQQGQQGDRQRRQQGQMSQQTGDQTNYRTAYWEGYYDGFNDDDFGYDHWSDQWGQSYSSAYTDGYYDGYYDQESQYGYDPNYYIYSVSVTPTSETDQQRAERQRGEQRRQGDETRARGDRGATGTAGRTQLASRDIKSVAALSLIRGNVSNISEAERPDKPDHTVLRIDFQDRDPVTVDFGPHMTRQRLPFESGDRVSLVGFHNKTEQGETMIISQIAHEGKIYKLRGQKDAQRDMDRQRRDRPQRPGGGG